MTDGTVQADTPNASTTACDTKSNFGASGWMLIGLSAALMWISSGSIAHGLNVILPAIASTHHLDYTQLLALATPASWMSVVSGYFGAKLCQRIGAKPLIIAGLLLGGLSFGCMGQVGSLWAFAVLFSSVCIFDTTCAFIGGPAMIGAWFPRKQSLAMGWATMGQTISTATYVPITAMIFASLGVRRGFWAVPALMGIVALIFLRFPSANPKESLLSKVTGQKPGAKDLSERSFTTRELLGMKDVWLMGVSYGGIFIVVVGVISQLVPRLISMGVSEAQAIRAMTIAALVGTPGAWVWGALSQHCGVKISSIIYALWYSVAIAIHLLSGSAVTFWVSLLMIGFGLSGATNLSVSIVGEKFPGRQFVAAWGVVNPIQSILRCCAFAILAFGLHNLGGFRGSYLILIAVGLASAILLTQINVEPASRTHEA